MRPVVILILLSLFSTVLSLNNGLARTPALGYNTWNDFGCDVTAQDIINVANAFVRQNLTAYGYEYVNLDDCWAGGRYPNGTVYANPQRFPNGIAPLAEYVHSLGLKFGLYTDRGNYTCQHCPGSSGYEQIDADTYASWGVDYLKEDSCYASQDPPIAFKEYGIMRDALNNSGRPIYFSLCGIHWWYAPPGHDLGNSWRIANDCANWSTVLIALNVNSYLAGFSGPGGWNDPDMLIGTSNQAEMSLTQPQSRTQFSLWSLMAAPLLIGSTIVDLNPFDLETYTNQEVIDVDQDPLGIQGVRIFGEDLSGSKGTNVWGRVLQDNCYALLFLNNEESNRNITCDGNCLAKLGINDPQQVYAVRDLWAHTNNGTLVAGTGITVENVVAQGGSVTLKITPVS